MAEEHDWHLFDVEKGYECRQVTDSETDNVWEIRDKDGNVTQLSDDEFEQFRAEGDNPKGLE